MEIYQLKQFVAVVETGSFTRGADRVAVSQPALSATIAKLEDEFQVKLLERRRGAVIPTAAGRRLYAGAEAILQNCNEVRSQVRAVRSVRQLRVGVLRTLPTASVARLLQAYRQNQPDVLIELQDGSSADLDERLKSGRLDLAITLISGSDYPPDREQRLYEEKYVALLNSHHPLAGRSSVPFSELNDEPFIVRTSCETFLETTQLMKKLNVRPRIVYKTDQDDRTVALVRAGVGVVLLPESFNDGTVTQLNIDELQLVRIIGIRSATAPLTEDQILFSKFAVSHRWL